MVRSLLQPNFQALNLCREAQESWKPQYLCYGIYAGISVLELMFLMLGKVPFYEALVNTMTSICTAGILDYHGTVDMYFTPYVKMVIAIFSIISSLNFLVYINIYQGRMKHIIKDIESRAFLIIIAVATLLTAGGLFISGTSTGIKESLLKCFLRCSFICMHKVVSYLPMLEPGQRFARLS